MKLTLQRCGYLVQRRPVPNHSEPGYGGYDQDHQIAQQMSRMDLQGPSRGHPDRRPSYETTRSHEDYGRHQGYGEPRRGPPAEQAGGSHRAYDDSYAVGRPGPAVDDFGPPSRSMTMPVNNAEASRGMHPPQPLDTAPFGGPAGQPPRPSTAAGQRPPPQRMYTPNPQAPPQNQYDEARGYGHPPAAPGSGSGQALSVDDVFNSYYDSPRVSGSDHQDQYAGQQSRGGHLDSGPAHNGRSNSFDQPTHSSGEHAQPGAHGTPRLHHAKSEANVHEAQAAVFEMAGDIPSMPTAPAAQVQPYRPEYGQAYGAPAAGYDQLPPRGPSAPPGPVYAMRPGPGGLNGDAGMGRTSSNPENLPSHPAPVRPGLMANSVVSVHSRPPPVRNYSGVPSQQPPQQAPQPQYAQSLPPQNSYQQQQQQQQPPPPSSRGGYQPAEVTQVDEPVTSQDLERLRMAIKTNAGDQASALLLAKKLIEAADMLAPKLPDPKQRLRARERYLVDAHKVLKKLANTQNIEAMFILADSMGKGLFGNEPDNKEAFTLYQSAAKLGHAGAAYRTAVCCEIGHEEGGGTRKDPLKAMQWYKRAATLGDPPAMYKVGMILLKGLLGQPKNPREAVGWLKRAAERADAENPHALHELGLLYEAASPNDAIVRDEAYALSLFQQAADLGYKFSQHKLGSVFEHGTMNCPVEPRQSIYWYSRAAAQEEHQSELALSGWYLTGSEGVLNQSDTEAYLWARKAAVAGLAMAEYAMGYFTETGIGVPANLEDAKRWYWRAAGM